MPGWRVATGVAGGESVGVTVVVGDDPVLQLRPDGCRVRVGLVVPAVDRVADLSARPSSAVGCLDAAAERAGVARQAAHRRVARALDEAGRDAAWSPADPDLPLLGRVGGAAFPLLGAAYDRGAAPVGEVPRWATAVLAEPEPREAARCAFGEVATRPVARALAAALAGGDRGACGGSRPVGLHALGLAMVAAPVLDADRLARLLVEAAAHPAPDDELTVDGLASTRTLARALGPRRAARVLTEAAARTDGLALLLDLARLWPDVSPRLPSRLPNRLQDLHDVCRSLVATDRHPAGHRPPGAVAMDPQPAGPSPRPADPRPRPEATVPTRQRQAPVERGTPAEVRARAYHPPPPRPDPVTRRMTGTPAAARPVSASTPIPVDPRLAALDGAVVGGVRFALPRTCGDLERWGRILRSCVADFGPAAATGATNLVGLFDGARLRGCLELRPDGRIQQMLGAANRPLTRETRAKVLSALVDHRVVDRRDPRLDPWFADLP